MPALGGSNSVGVWSLEPVWVLGIGSFPVVTRCSAAPRLLGVCVLGVPCTRSMAHTSRVWLPAGVMPLLRRRLHRGPLSQREGDYMPVD